jgi:hypothetical protein
LFPALYAAFAHLLDIASSGTPYQRFQVLALAGSCAVRAWPDHPPPDGFEGELEAFLAAVRVWSVPFVLQHPPETELNYALEAVGGLRHREAAAVWALEFMVEEHYEVTCECPACHEPVYVWMRDAGPHGLALDHRGQTLEDFRGQLAVDRSDHSARLELGASLLGTKPDPSWPAKRTTEVLAHLANRCGQPRLATRLLDLSARIACPYPHCRALWTVESAVERDV